MSLFSPAHQLHALWGRLAYGPVTCEEYPSKTCSFFLLWHNQRAGEPCILFSRLRRIFIKGLLHARHSARYLDTRFIGPTPRLQVRELRETYKQFIMLEWAEGNGWYQVLGVMGEAMHAGNMNKGTKVRKSTEHYKLFSVVTEQRAWDKNGVVLLRFVQSRCANSDFHNDSITY